MAAWLDDARDSIALHVELPQDCVIEPAQARWLSGLCASMRRRLGDAVQA
jgi:hypothetical protein